MNILSLISQRLDNYYQIQTKYYSVATGNFGTPNFTTNSRLEKAEKYIVARFGFIWQIVSDH
jgi:hypothetical protein